MPLKLDVLADHCRCNLRATPRPEPQHRALPSIAGGARDAGHYAEAEGLFRKVLASRLDTLGEAHPTTVATKMALGVCLHWKADLDGAETMLREVLGQLRKAHGVRGAETVSAVSALGMVLKDKHEFGEAALLLREASEVTNEVLGSSHAEAHICRGNLGGLLKETGDAAAEGVLRQAIDGLKGSLGEGHVATSASVVNLALVMQGKGELTGAEAMLRGAAQASRHSMGAGHPSTQAVFAQLGALLEAKGDMQAALEVHSDALSGFDAPAEASKRVADRVAALLQRLGRGADAEAVLKTHGVYA